MAETLEVKLTRPAKNGHLNSAEAAVDVSGNSIFKTARLA
jgi:hypothetical protein